MDNIIYKKSIELRIDGKVLKAIQSIPFDAKEIVIFSHGSGSGSSSPRNRLIAEMLNKKNIATLLIDLLTPKENDKIENRFNVELLTERLIGITKRISEAKCTDMLNIGYFGASTGAASALNASAFFGGKLIKAIVSRGGRPDLSMPYLDKVESPVLLIVGEMDTDVIKLNKKAFDKLNCEKKLEIVSGSSHLFEEPGKLEIVGELAIEWYSNHLVMKKNIAPVGDLMYPFPWS